jgi:hypothetical protein
MITIDRVEKYLRSCEYKLIDISERYQYWESDQYFPLILRLEGQNVEFFVKSNQENIVEHIKSKGF